MMFPFDKIRPLQKDFMERIDRAFSQGDNLIAHAPTGVGKTAAVLASALPHVLDKDLTLFFLTPKHTQHRIVIETLRKIGERHSISINVSDFIGKQWLCLVPGAKTLPPSDFSDFCSDLRRDEMCDFYGKRGLSTSRIIEEISGRPMHSEDVREMCSREKVCPYEVLMRNARNSQVVIGDYYHIFSEGVRQSFLKRMDKSLADSILIVDEAHNLAERVKSLLSSSLNQYVAKMAVKETQDFGFPDQSESISGILSVLGGFGEGQKRIGRENFISMVEAGTNRGFLDLQEELSFIGERIRSEKRRSFVGSVSRFMERWMGDDRGFLRYTEGDKSGRINYKCLDPGVLTGPIFSEAHSSILMSGTLTPTRMYSRLLGLSAEQVTYGNPFPKGNRLSLICPSTTTKYTERDPSMFLRIGRYCSRIADACPGNSAIFFPSYAIMEKVMPHIDTGKKVIVERPGLSKRERAEIFNEFTSGPPGLLLGVAGGSFAEGVDYPGKFLECVVVVGIPLGKPDIETRARIDYYEEKFGAGWSYGYIFPAMNRAIQASGRAIRSETDKGVIVLMDKRYLWKNYMSCIPPDLGFKVSMEPWLDVEDFFS